MINRSLANKNKLSPNDIKSFRSCRSLIDMALSIILSYASIVDHFKKCRIGISHPKTTSRGFTIVELLVVIVVIGILAAITVVSYTGISSRANIAVMQSDLSNASDQLKIYQVTYGSYPTVLNGSNCPTSPNDDTAYCLKTSGSNIFAAYTSNGTTFGLTETNPNGMAYNVTDSTTVAAGAFVDWTNWYSGIAATVLAGKHIYKTDLGSTYMYETAGIAVTSPQGATGLDPNYPSSMSLVSPQANPNVDFSAYPAQNACKAIGGRLPNVQELLAIYAGRAAYGNNFRVDNNGNYRSSTEYDSNSASIVYFGTGNWNGSYKTDGMLVRCVSG